MFNKLILVFFFAILSSTSLAVDYVDYEDYEEYNQKLNSIIPYGYHKMEAISAQDIINDFRENGSDAFKKYHSQQPSAKALGLESLSL